MTVKKVKNHVNKKKEKLKFDGTRKHIRKIAGICHVHGVHAAHRTSIELLITVSYLLERES